MKSPGTENLNNSKSLCAPVLFIGNLDFTMKFSFTPLIFLGYACSYSREYSFLIGLGYWQLPRRRQHRNQQRNRSVVVVVVEMEM